MKVNFSFRSCLYLSIIVLSALVVSCAHEGKAVNPDDTGGDKAEGISADEPGDKERAKPKGVELYKDEPAPILPVQCGSCHKVEYKRLQLSNSRHRFDCLKCHTKLHSYIPPRKNWHEIMPKCARCHGFKHGKEFPDCLQCHIDPHSPLDIPFSGVEHKVVNSAGREVVACEVCHYDPEGKEMETYPCKHNTAVGCTGCHADKHGVRPSCFDCHEPHVQGQTYADCLVCHRPHSAKNILKYPEDMNNNVCGSCHTGLYQNLQQNHTKHSDLYCAACHERHGEIPECQKCHGEPHGALIHKRFPRCLDCHMDPHNLPVKK